MKTGDRLTSYDWQLRRYAETYISVDIEASGPCPGKNSMLSLGAAAFTRDGTLLGTFYINLEELPGSERDPNTMKFWADNDVAWKATQTDQVNPKAAMEKFLDWLKDFENPVFVAYPAGFDFSFVYWYLTYFDLKNPFSWSALDMKTFAMAILNTPYRRTIKSAFPSEWFSKKPHTHHALDDAIEQGETFTKMLKEMDRLTYECKPQNI